MRASVSGSYPTNINSVFDYVLTRYRLDTGKPRFAVRFESTRLLCCLSVRRAARERAQRR